MNKRQKLAQKRQMQLDGYGVTVFEIIVLTLAAVGIYAMFMQLVAYLVGR